MQLRRLYLSFNLYPFDALLWHGLCYVVGCHRSMNGTGRYTTLFTRSILAH